MQALAKWPNLVKKIIMLDSHFLRSQNSLPSVSGMLDIMLSKDNSIIKNRVESAYRSIIANDVDFKRALKFAIEWVNTSFSLACNMVSTMPVHSALYVGFTNSGYQMLDAKDKELLLVLWEKFNVDVKFLSMNHFDLIDDSYAVSINQLIVGWFNQSSS